MSARRGRADIDARKLGFSVTAFVHVKLAGHSDGNARHFRDLVNITKGILEAHALTGDFDYVLKICVRAPVGNFHCKRKTACRQLQSNSLIVAVFGNRQSDQSRTILNEDADSIFNLWCMMKTLRFPV